MRPNRVKQLWRDGAPVAVNWLLSGNPFLAEVLAHAGADAILIDMQHGPGLTPAQVVSCLQAINTTDTVPFVRVPWNDPVHMQYVLDAGAYGVVIPLVNSAEDAARAVGACRYPPLGFRSAGPNRVSLGEGADYLSRANDEIACLVMIEHIDAVNAIEEIARVPGLDGFFVGPGDLALSLGLPASLPEPNPEHTAAITRVREVAQANGLVAGIACGGAEDARRRAAEGFTFCAFGTDWGFVDQGARNALAVFRGE